MTASNPKPSSRDAIRALAAQELVEKAPTIHPEALEAVAPMFAAGIALLRQECAAQPGGD